ncbi:hypothetical protein K474DRAFT_1693846 [Panus rudis PR-1116 ss-1]|nr:hypothetical protein K474DRAFT_1693846 [Panus rudis PR-1116 ss-1]
MGNEVSRAGYMALGSFAINFATQTYGMVSSPNMKEVANANHFAFSPNPWFIAAFFSGQTVLQAVWIRQIFALKPGEYQRLTDNANKGANANSDKSIEEQAAIKATLEYVPIFALGNLCIAGWLYAWLGENFVTSQVLVTINTFAHLYAVARLPQLTVTSSRLMKLTHLVAKTIAGIGILDFVDNGGVAARIRAPPSTLLQAATYILFPAAAALSTPTFGWTLVYDLAALYVGQRFGAGPAADSWGNRLGLTALAVGGIVGFNALNSGGRRV